MKAIFLMKTVTYKKEDLDDYLLRNMPENDANLFDELSITDDEFVADLKSAEADLVDAYINGELKNPNLEKFETNYLVSPLRREKVEFARALQIVAEKNFAKTSEVIEKDTSRSDFAFWDIFNNFNSMLRLGFAALMIAVVGIFGWFLMNINEPIEQVKVENTPTPQPTIQPTQTPNTNQSTPTPTISPKNVNVEKTPEPKITPTNSPTPKIEPTVKPTQNVPTLATFMLLSPSRSTSLQTISIPTKTTDVAFGLPLESVDFKNYRVFLKNESGKILWQSGKMTSKKSALSVRFPAKLLQSNIYSLAVVGIGEDNQPENLGNYSFRSVIK